MLNRSKHTFIAIKKSSFIDGLGMPTSYSLDGGRQPSGCVGRKGEQKTMLDGICRISQIMLSEICRLFAQIKSKSFATLGIFQNILLLFC
jgi:hypothetical protein